MCDCNGQINIGCPDCPQGDPGTSAYVYIRYASDNIGTGISSTPSNSLDYIGVLNSNTVLTPVAGDFTWVKYQGADGSNGADGADGQDVSANNGLTENTPGNVQLGGTLLQNTTINTGIATATPYRLTIIGDGPAGDFGLLTINETDTGAENALYISQLYGGTAIKVESAAGTGINITVNDGRSGSFTSYTTSNTNAIEVFHNSTDSSSVIDTLYLSRAVTGGSGANGVGLGITLAVENSSGLHTCNEIQSKWINATHAARTSKLIFKSYDAGLFYEVLSITGNTVGIGISTTTAPLQVAGIIEYADNAAAIVGGLTAGAFYRTADVLKIVH